MKNIEKAWRWVTAPRRRVWEYRVACAALGVAATYNAVQADAVAGLYALLSALFGQASAHVDGDSEQLTARQRAIARRFPKKPK